MSPPAVAPDVAERCGGFARLASMVCGVESAVVALKHGERFEIAGANGLKGPAAQLQATGIFAETVRRDIIFELVRPELPRPKRLGERHVYHSYAGLPMKAADGHVLGVLALLDSRSRYLSRQQRQDLELLAQGLAALMAPPVLQAPQLTHDLLMRILSRSPEPTLLYQLSSSGDVPIFIGSNTAYAKVMRLVETQMHPDPFAAVHGPQTDRDILAAAKAAARSLRPMRATLALYPLHAEEPHWFELSGYPVAVEGRPSFWIEHFHDVTVRAVRITELATERNRLQRTLSSMADAVITLDQNGRLRFMNQAARSLLDLRGILSVAQLAEADERILQLRDIATEELLTKPFAVHLRPVAPHKQRALVMTRAQERRYIEYMVTPVERPQRGPDGFVVVLRDVTAEEVLTRRLSFEAGHDQLTGIANRRNFEQALARALSTAKNADAVHTLAFMDLDRFKVINDSCGHASGDMVLRDVAQLFKAQLRAHDVIARFGGDEFAILMHDCTPKTAARVVSRIRAAIAGYRWHGQGKDYTLGVSIGLAEITQATFDAATVLRDADAACYADKATHQRDHYIPTVTGAGERYVGGSTRATPWTR